MAERFNNSEKNTMRLWARCFQLTQFCCVMLLMHTVHLQETFSQCTGSHFSAFGQNYDKFRGTYRKMLDCITYFGHRETKQFIACHPHAVLSPRDPNCSHPTLISVCYSTSPSWRVQRLNHGDWLSPPPPPSLVDIYRLECKEGPLCTSVCIHSEYCSHWLLLCSML